ncbi:hypothetical protein [Streptomyces sp. NBC_00347]|uniref:hypothetical protein n=1 Tax=Streptomyces sp. NBC_00347 TaxID=2975721 RepID=UPI00224F9FBB|nr:hypothetical protein [Streptomyces sp. NBC_00347]MCX5124632.1 hypothetical protein [Streptomyces sp. NBC_00347]
MPKIWIGLDASDRRTTWVWTGFLILIWAGATAGIMLSAGSDASREERWVWAGVLAVFWLAGAFHLVNRAYGGTLLTSERIEFRTFVSRRSISWAEITGIEEKSHYTRAGGWRNIRGHLLRGRTVAIPGTFTARRRDADFDRKLAVIRKYWLSYSEATAFVGRPSEVGKSRIDEGAGHEVRTRSESAGEVGKHLLRKPSLLILVLSVAVITATIGVVVVPAPFQTLPGIVGVPLIVWMIHKDRARDTPSG